MEVLRYREGNNGPRRHSQQGAGPVLKSKPSGSRPLAFNHASILPVVLSAPVWVWDSLLHLKQLSLLHLLTKLCVLLSQVSVPSPPPTSELAGHLLLMVSQDQRAPDLLQIPSSGLEQCDFAASSANFFHSALQASFL